MMDHKQMQKFRMNFEKIKSDLIGAQNEFKEKELKMSRDEMADESDFAKGILEQTMTIRLRNRQGLYLNKIEAALKRIENGTFGLCMDCEEPIESRRLEARPTATLCLSCKEAQEKRESGFAHHQRLVRVAQWEAETA